MTNNEEKEKRAPPFTESEKLVLCEAIKERHEILFGKLSPKLTAHTKAAAWKEVLEAVRKVSGVQRTITQLKEKHKNMKKEAKSTAAHNKKEITQTGGGSANIIEINACSQVLLDTMPKSSITGVEGGIDTSIPQSLDMRKEVEAGEPKRPSFVFVGGSTTNSNNASASLLSRPLVPRRNEGSEEEDEIAVPQKTPRRKRDTRNPMEVLMEKQIELFKEQVICMRAIENCLKRRNEIEEEKLELKRGRRGDISWDDNCSM